MTLEDTQNNDVSSLSYVRRSCGGCSCNRNSPCLLYLFAFTAISLSSGLVYGFPHLRNNLLYYSGSVLSESQLGIVYTVGSWSNLAARLGFGIARDIYGTKYIAFLSLFCAALGCIGIAFSDANNIASLSISFFFVGLGSGGQLCLQPVASMFRKQWQGTILASFSGAFQISALVFLVLIQITHDRVKSYASFAIVLFGLGVCALVLLPRYQFIPHQEMVDNNDDGGDLDDADAGMKNTRLQRYDTVSTKNPHDMCLTEEDEQADDHDRDAISSIIIIDVNEENQEEEGIESKDEDEKIVKATQLLKSLEYILLVSWFSFLVIPLQYYVGIIGFHLEEKGDNDGTYVNLFSIFYATAAIFSPVMGKVADTCGLGASQLIATALTAASFFTLASTSEGKSYLNLQLFGMACYGIGRMAVFGMFFTNVGKRFGYTHYGTLAGMGLLISALFSLFQYPLIDIAARGHEYYVNLTCGVVILIFGSLYCFWLGLREWNEREARSGG